MEKFYCVGCKQHYELKVHTPQRQASKGGSYRHSLISECPKGHRVNKLCKKEVYETYSETFESPYAGSKALSGVSLTTDQLTETIGSGTFDEASLNSSGNQNIFANAEEGNTPVQDPMEFGEMANWTPLDGTPSLKKRKRAEDYRDSYEAEKYTYESLGKYNDDELREILTKMNEKSEKKLLSGDLKYGNTQLLKNLILGFQNLDSPYDSIGGHQYVRPPKFKYGAEGMTVGVNLEALAPTPDEPETGESLVPADSLLPEGSGHVIGSQSTSHNFTPFHSEDFIPWSEEADSEDCYICGKDNSAYYVEEEDNICSSCDSNWEYDSDMDGYVKKKAEDFDAETFIAYPELKDHLVSIMPDKVYGITSLDDGDFEMKVANRYMDEVIEAVSNYQQTQSDSDLMFGQSKTKIALAAAGVAVLGAWIWNNRK